MDQNAFTIEALTGAPASILIELPSRKDAATLRDAADNVVVAAAYAVLKDKFRKNAIALMQPQLEEIRDTYAIMNGVREDSDNWDEWDSGLDDQLEKLFEPLARVLSQDWLANNLIDARLETEGRAERMTHSFADELWLNLTFHKGENDKQERQQKSAGQVLSSVGLVARDLKEALANVPDAKPKEFDMSDLNEAIARMHDQMTVLGTYDKKAVIADLDLASDDDDILAMGAIERLGGTLEDIDALRMWRLTDGNFDKLADTIEAYEPGGAPAAAPASKPAAAPKKGEAGKVQKDADGPGFDVTVLEAAKAYGGLTDATLAEKLGMSRGSLNNYLKGKSVLKPDADQLKFLKELMYEISARVSAAYKIITDYEAQG